MTDLVTGGAGFLGRHVARALVRRGRKVRVLDLREDPDPPEGVEHWTGSITDAHGVAAAMDGVERVFHLAAIPELWLRDKSRFDLVNRQGTEIVLAAARACSTVRRFVHTSSEVVLVPGRGAPLPERLDESVDLPPEALIGPYARSKRRAELAVLEAAGEGFPATVVIPTMPLGPGDVTRTPPTRMLADLLAGRTPAYMEMIMNIVDARDAAEGHVLAAEHGAPGARYILGGDNLPMSEFLRALTPLADRPMPSRRIPQWLGLGFAFIDQGLADHLTGKPPKAPRDGVAIACRQRPFDNARARDDLGFAPRPIARTLADTVAWLSGESEPVR